MAADPGDLKSNVHTEKKETAAAVPFLYWREGELGFAEKSKKTKAEENFF